MKKELQKNCVAIEYIEWRKKSNKFETEQDKQKKVPTQILVSYLIQKTLYTPLRHTWFHFMP